MLDLDFTFALTALNLAVLYWILNKFLFSRLGGFMEARSKAIAADIEKGRALSAEGEAHRAKCEQELREGAEESRRMIAEAKERAAREYDAILAQAKKDAERVLADAREQAKREAEQLAARLKSDVADLSILAASKLMEANMDSAANREMVKRFLDKEVAA